MAPPPAKAANSGQAIQAPAIRLADVSLSFGTLPVFSKLHAHFPAGQTTCLLGASGVGKSSLLRLIAGLSGAAAGRVDDAKGQPLDGRMAYMAQEDLLLPWFDVFQNVTLGARLRGEDLREDKVVRARHLIAAVGLAGWEKSPPAQLSGGMRQRVALARTLMEGRPLVLMDEPFAALDAITRFEIQALSAGLLAGRTVIMVTHDPAEALRMAHRIHVLSGRPAALAPALTLAGTPPRQPGTPELARLQADLLAQLSAAQAAQSPAREHAAS